MSDTPNDPTDTDTTDAVPDPAVEAQAAEPAPDDAQADDTTAETAEPAEATPASREAAKYRRRLRETEAKLDKMTERVAAYDRREAERIAAQHLADGADIWRDGATVDSLLGDDGGIDAEKVIELVKATATAHPHWQRRGPQKKVQRGPLLSGASSADNQSTPSWSRLLRDDRRAR